MCAGAAAFTGSPVTQPEIGGLDLSPHAGFRGLDDKIPSPVFGFLVLAAAILLALLVANVRRSSLGQRMLAVRSNERAAAAAGINVRNTKLAGFGIAAFVAGMAGASTRTTSARSATAASARWRRSR